MSRITVWVEDDEHEALIEFARIEKRDPRSQAAMIIREFLERRGLLPLDVAPTIKREGLKQGEALPNAAA